MQVPKSHLPVVGLLGLVVVAAAAGGVYYYQFVVPHAIALVPASHRLIFMTAIVFEEGGFHITNTAYLNQSSLPAVDSTNGRPILTGVNFTDYRGSSDNRTIFANVGDTVTFYIEGLNATSPDIKLHASNAHGFQILGPTTPTVVDESKPPGTIFFGKWYTLTVTFSTAGTYTYLCTIFCSPGHGQMTGNIAVT